MQKISNAALGELVTNDANQPQQLQVNVHTAVNSKQITRQAMDGRDYYVVPSYTLPANVVMNRILYPAHEIDAHYKGIEGTLAPLGHPTVNGLPVAAATQQGLTNYVGAANRNVQKVGERIYVEKWVDIEQAKMSTNGQRLLGRIEGLMNGTDTAPIHTSIALFINRLPAPQGVTEYDSIAKFIKIDHDAILLDEPGAATPEQGVGMVVNCSDATELHVNEGLLKGMSYETRKRMLREAARSQFQHSDDNWIYVSDFDDTQAVININDKYSIHTYAIESGKVVIDANGTPVIEQSFWAPVVNRFKKFLNPQAQKTPATNQKESEMTEAERAAFLAEVKGSVTALIKPLSDSVGQIAANQQAMADQIKNAPAAAAEAEMRKDVAAKHGDIVANALSGDALKAMHDSCKTAAGAGALSANSQKPADVDMVAHFGFTKE